MRLQPLPLRWSLVISKHQHRLTLTQIKTLREQCDKIIYAAAEYHPIVCKVAAKMQIPAEAIMSRSRTEPIIIARFCCYLLMRREGLSFKAIGIMMKRDHGAVIFGLKSLEEKLWASKALREQLAWLENGAI